MTSVAARLVLASASLLWLAACDRKPSPPVIPLRLPAPVEGWASEVSCRDSTAGTAEGLVCALYRAHPTPDHGGKGPPRGGFLDLFAPELRPLLAKTESYAVFLYDDASAVSRLRVGRYDPASRRVKVTYRHYDWKRTIVFTLRRDSGFVIEDAVYDPGWARPYTLREALLPSSAAPAPADESPRDRYLRMRERYRLMPVQGVLGSAMFDKYPREKRKAILREHEALERFLVGHIGDALPPLEIPGFTRGYNILAECVYDGKCLNLDGIVYHPREGEKAWLVLTDLALLKGYLEDVASEPVELNSVSDLGKLGGGVVSGTLIQDANFIGFGVVPVTLPEGLDFAQVWVGYSTNGGTYEAPASDAYAIATQGERVFLVALEPDEKDFPRIPACHERFHAWLKERDVVCDPDCYSVGHVDLLNKADEVYQRCYAEAFPSAPEYPAFRTRAEAVLARLAAARP